MRIGTILGIPLRLDPSWILIFLLVTVSLARGFFPGSTPGLTYPAYLAMGAAASLLLFVCIILHELAHAVVGRRYGLEFEEIVLFLFGGVARMRNEPESPRAEFFMAAAGPLMSAALATALWGLGQLPLHPSLLAVLGYLVFLNLFLVVFNLVPGFPLDGGRMFRAAVWHFTGDLPRATRTAALSGQGFGGVLIALGLLDVLLGHLGGLWTAFIGWFLFSAARMSYAQSRLEEALGDISVRQVMNPDPPVVGTESTVGEAVRRMAVARTEGIPVLESGRLIGQVEARQIRRVPAHEWDHVPVGTVMTPVDRRQVVREGEPALQAFRSNSRQLFVLSGEHLAGVVDRESLWSLARICEEQRQAS